MEGYAADRQAKAPQAGGSQGVAEQHDDLGVGLGRAQAEKLGPELHELALAPVAAGLGAVDRTLVGQAQRQRPLTQPVGGQASDGGRQVGAQHERPAALVVEMEARRQQVDAGPLHRLGVLERRGDVPRRSRTH